MDEAENLDVDDELPPDQARDQLRAILIDAYGKKELARLAKLAEKDKKTVQWVLVWKSQTLYAERIAEMLGGMPDYSDANQTLESIRSRLTMLSSQHPSEN